MPLMSIEIEPLAHERNYQNQCNVQKPEIRLAGLRKTLSLLQLALCNKIQYPSLI